MNSVPTATSLTFTVANQSMMHLTDKRQLLRTLTARRVWNGLKMLTSFYVSRLTQNPVHWAKPVSLSLEPTTACNLGCPECPSGKREFTRPTGNTREGDYQQWIDELAREALYLNFYFQGEPFIHPRLLDMVRYAKSKKLYTSTSTNAHFLNDRTARETVLSGLDRLIISIDGTTQEVYQQYRVHGDLAKVLEGTRNMVRWKKELKSSTPLLIFQFLVVKPNEHQIHEVLALAKELEVDEVRFKTAQVYDYKNGHPLIPEREKYSRYRRMPNGEYSIKNALDNHCWRMWSSCVITWNGTVVPCCFDKDARHALGSLNEQTFDAIWNNTAYRSFRNKLFTSRRQIDICANCSEGTSVWA
jgi:radical SAM protein with 4Fe4S-binding SPASM domain